MQHMQNYSWHTFVSSKCIIKIYNFENDKSLGCKNENNKNGYHAGESS